jgi:hypothetical protein
VSNPRDDFSALVKTMLARRVGHRCSNPVCQKPTSGPAQDPEKAVNIGVAAHITAAAEGGPRYDKSLSAEERAAQANGIWLCQTCSKLIDADEQRFVVDLLHRWKRDAQARVLRDQTQMPRWLASRGVPADADSLRRISETRTRRRLRNIVDDDTMLLRALDALSATELPSPLITLEPGRILVLVGELGTGKSEIAEIWHRSSIDTYAGGAGPVPVWMPARATQRGLPEMVAQACGGEEHLLSLGCDLVLDELDAINDLRRVRELLDEAAVFAESAGNVRVVATIRPGYPVPTSEIVPITELTLERGIEIASSIAQIPEWQMAHRLTPELAEAARTPLLAVLIGAEAASLSDLADRPSLLHRLAERALEAVAGRTGVVVVREQVRATLRRIAIAATNGVQIRASDIAFGGDLVASRILAEGQYGELRFPLAILEQVFAAEALTHREVPIDDIVSDLSAAVTWRYPIAVALATNPEIAADQLLDPMARAHPGLASWLVREALTVSGYRVREGSGTQVQDSTPQPHAPASAQATLSAGRAVRNAMSAWLNGLRELRHFLLFDAPDGTLRSLGVGLSVDGTFEACWAAAGSQLPEVFCLNPSHAPPELEAIRPLIGRPGWGPSRSTAHVASRANWQWQWTAEHIVMQLKPLIERRSLLVRPGSHLAAERDWHLACLVVGQGNTNHQPIDPAVVLRAIEIAEASIDGNFIAMRSTDGTTSRLNELHHLASRCEQLVGRGELLRRPAPAPDNPPGYRDRGWVWHAYSPERLRELTESVWREALLGYGQLVADHFPRIGRTLSLAALGQPKVEGTLITSDKSGFQGSPLLDYTFSALDPDHNLDTDQPLTPGSVIATPHVTIRQVAEHEWHESHSSVPRARNLTRLIPRGVTAAAFAAAGGAQTGALDVYDHSPATNLAYKWLSIDLKQLGWL